MISYAYIRHAAPWNECWRLWRLYGDHPTLTHGLLGRRPVTRKGFRGISCLIFPKKYAITHWGRVTHKCVSKLIIIGSDNGLSPGRRQAIIWTNAGISLIGPLATNFIETLIGIQTFSFTKMHLKMSSAKWRPFCLGLNVIMCQHGAGTPPILSVSGPVWQIVEFYGAVI